MRGLKAKTLLVTIVPILLVLGAISGIAIDNKYQSESQLLLDRFSSYKTLLENGDLSFDTVRDKTKLKSILGEETIFSEILHSDLSVAYSSEHSPAPLITPEEKTRVDGAFSGTETVVTERVKGKPVVSIITPLVVDGKVVAVLHLQLSNVESSARVNQYAVFMILLMLGGLIVCFLLINALLGGVIIKNVLKLKQGMVAIQNGRFDKLIEVKSNDEIGELAESFNQITKKLLDSQHVVNDKLDELSSEHGKISSLVESIKLGVVMVDLNLNVILSNSAARAVFGPTPKKAITFKDLAEKIKGQVDIPQALSSYVKRGKPLNIQEAMIGDRYYRLFMSPVRDIVQKTFIGAVFVMEDVTEERSLNRMRTEIISVTSHQLRTPATIIKGNLEMVLGGDAGKITPQQRELLSDTYMGNERMIHLVNDLLDASKIDEGKYVLMAAPEDLEGLLDEVVKEVSAYAVGKKVALVFDHPATALPKANINRKKVKQILLNLIDNAIKYSSVGDKGKVAVSLQASDNFLQFSVRDNGIGIPSGDRARIFERFYRGSNSTKLDPGGGSGLGLYIAKGVIEQGGGKIWFDTKEGEGTTFYATFPAV